LRQTSSILYIAVDSLINERGSSNAGFDEFTAALDHAAIPAVWLTARSRLQFDDARRKHGHVHPFVTEDGCCVCLPEDYFHLKPGKTVRLGRFTCIPVAQPLPAASEALQSLAQETSVQVVPLESLSPRELLQNTGLSQRDAELLRQRDFDELFFFAGASERDVQSFLEAAAAKQIAVRQHGVLYSLALGPSIQRCVRDLAKLYDRALRYHAHIVGIATRAESSELLPHCERSILLEGTVEKVSETGARTQILPLRAADTWARLLEVVTRKAR
jgi:hypothetical protein